MEPVLRVDDGDAWIVIDTRELPLLLVRWGRVMTVPLLEQFFATQRALLTELGEQGRTIVVISDALEAENPRGVVRRRLLRETLRLRPFLHPVCIADAVVTTNPLVRTVVNMARRLDRDFHRVETFESLEEARAWGLEQVARHRSATSSQSP